MYVKYKQERITENAFFHFTYKFLLFCIPHKTQDTLLYENEKKHSGKQQSSTSKTFKTLDIRMSMKYIFSHFTTILNKKHKT